MIPYEFGYWGVGLVFRRSNVLFRAACWGFAAGVATFLFSYFRHYLISEKSIPDLTTLWGGWTFTITFLLAFRTNIAHGRYIEGLGLLHKVHGFWINAASNLIAFSSLDASKSSPDKEAVVIRFRHLLIRLISLMYCTALQEVAVMEDEDFDLIATNDLGHESLIHLLQSTDRLEITLQWVQQLICEHHQNGCIWIAPPILSRVFQELSNGVVLVHEAVKITEYPFPHPYAQMLTIMLLAYTTIFPLVLAVTLADPVSASLLSFVVIFSYWTMNYIAAEIEMPFGDDPNDLEIREMCNHFNDKLITLMDPLSMKVPAFSFNTRCSEERIEQRKFTVVMSACTSKDMSTLSMEPMNFSRISSNGTDLTRQSLGSVRQSLHSRCSASIHDDSKRGKARLARKRAKGRQTLNEIPGARIPALPTRVDEDETHSVEIHATRSDSSPGDSHFSRQMSPRSDINDDDLQFVRAASNASESERKSVIAKDDQVKKDGTGEMDEMVFQIGLEEALLPTPPRENVGPQPVSLMKPLDFVHEIAEASLPTPPPRNADPVRKLATAR